jgi:hypothetical protein
MDAKNISVKLRKLAADLRKEAADIEQKKLIKSAKILTAARGIFELQQVLKGETNATQS